MALNQVPPEPKDIKQWIKSLRDSQEGATFDLDSLSVWFANKLPQYLWEQWKSYLKPHGFNWQGFLKLLRYRTDGAVMWLHDMMSWDEFIKQTLHLINGPLGKRISAQGKAKRIAEQSSNNDEETK